LELDEFEGTGTDRMLPHIARRHVAGINRRVTGSEERKKDRLRPLQMEGDLKVAIGGDPLEGPVPGLAGVDAKLLVRFSGQQVKGAANVRGRERPAVVSFDPVA